MCLGMLYDKLKYGVGNIFQNEIIDNILSLKEHIHVALWWLELPKISNSSPQFRGKISFGEDFIQSVCKSLFGQKWTSLCVSDDFSLRA